MSNFITALTALAALLTASASQAQTPPPALVPDDAVNAYMGDDQIVRLDDGRAIHLICMGQGSPTVILSSGLGSWSMTWRKVQPTVAEITRACAWDRAGVGFSDPSDAIQTVDVTTTDLEATLAAAGIDGPYVAVGHSMGAYETLLLADRRRDQLVGVVLVDPSIPDQVARGQAVAPTLSATDEADMAASVAKLRACAAALAEGRLPPGAPDPDGCLTQQPTFPAPVADALVQLDRNPRRHLTRASLTDNFPVSSRMVVDAERSYGDLPLMVLSAGGIVFTNQTTPEAVAENDAVRADFWAGHEAYAALSSRGERRIVPDSGHSIQREHPDAVIAAILEVVAAARATEQVDP